MTMNLVQHRGNADVWNASGMSTSWDVERWTACAAGTGLLFAGLRRGPAGGWLMIAAGSALAWWAVASRDFRGRRRGRIRGMWPGWRRQWDDPVAEASEESFPASDAPAWTPTTGNNPRIS